MHGMNLFKSEMLNVAFITFPKNNIKQTPHILCLDMILQIAMDRLFNVSTLFGLVLHVS